ncbi:isocitrate dehydrogenase [Desulfonauticus submarinus]|uniref:isocitrate dehydrogenase (NADP(+)) n=1 Tax=Desulfonauticus submarinus TaxID=206665 RepID=A0A1G9ZHX0_9BACT|nr:isocitrate dehydrogenase [Desulfonauticus submarinus]
METVYFIAGDGIGPEVMTVAIKVIKEALKIHNFEKKIKWQELLAGEKAFQQTGSYLPEETLKILKQARFAVKGPLTTPIGKGFRSLNVTLRQTFDLYACIRPIRYFQGISSPVKHPEKVNMIIFRENTEDVYAGIEWPANSNEAKKIISFLEKEFQINLNPSAGIGLKPMTEQGSKRLIKKAIEYALIHNKKSITLVHKGNIMKYTEGAFRDWGYKLAKQEFSNSIITEQEAKQGKQGIILKDRIADAMFQEVLLRPEEYDVIATTNLNGDYLSDALAAQVGGLGIAPGVNMGDSLALYEPTHGTAPSIAGQDKANPCSMILSMAMMLEHMGFKQVAQHIEKAIEKTILQKTVTIDLASQMKEAKVVGCKEFGDRVIANLEQ